MNLRDAVRRDKIIVKRREEEAKLKAAAEAARKAEAARIEQARIDEEKYEEDKRRAEEDLRRDEYYTTREEYDRMDEMGIIDKYSKMLFSSGDDNEMVGMKMQAIMKVLKGF